MKKKQLIRILLIDQDHAEAEWYLHSLRSSQFAFRAYLAKDTKSLDGFLNERICDLIIYIAQVEDLSIEETVKIIHRSGQDIPLIVICDREDKKSYMDAYNTLIQTGASALVEKGNKIQLIHTVVKEIRWLNDRRALKAARLSLNLYEEQYRQLSEFSKKPIAYIQHGNLVYANQEYLSAFNIADISELEEMDIHDFIASEDQKAFREFLESLGDHSLSPAILEIKLKKKDGAVFTSLCEFSPVYYHNEELIQLLLNDDSQNIMQDKSITRAFAETGTDKTDRDETPHEDARAQARHDVQQTARKQPEADSTEQRDPVTGLYTGDYFYKILDKAIEASIKEQIKSALLCVQHDNLEEINSQFGAVKTKDVLINTASILSLSVSPEDLAARLAEDIYGVLLKDMDLNSAMDLAEKIVSELENSPISIDGKKVETPFSIGVVPITGSQTTHQEVLANAFSACRKARRSRDKKVVIYNSKSTDATHLAGTLHLSREILEAINKNLFYLVYQPVASLKDHRGEFYEVFIRMEDSNGDIVPMEALFLEAAAHKLVTIIDEWVIANALKKLGERIKSVKETRFFINISVESITDRNILAVIEKHIKDNNIPGENLVFEISQGAVTSQASDVLAFIKGLKKLGCGTAIKHVGSGLKSLKATDQMPVDYIKIDTSVITNLKKDKEALGSLKAITQSAHESGRLTIAECLEDPSDLFVLFENSVDFAQGAYIQEPGTKMDFDFSRTLEDDYHKIPDNR
ncbi:MAG: EAL domain-containing protein [Gammaproteobacteria bacterium]